MWKELTKSEARQLFDSWDEYTGPMEIKANQHSDLLRNKLLTAEKTAREASEQYGKRKDYMFDLNYGLTLYKILYEEGFASRDASNDNIWIYLSMKILPDVVYRRWGMNDTRFFKTGRRIWLKTLWWYIHLSWQGTYERTFELLKELTTDEIVQLVERAGPYGYRIELTREIMRRLGESELVNRASFRKIMKLNTARVKIVEPSLVDGGTKKYVEELIGYFD